MFCRDQVGAVYLVAGWLAACLQLQVERVRGEKLNGFAAVLFVYDDNLRPKYPMIGILREENGCFRTVVCDGIRCTFSTSARVERKFAEITLA